MRSIELQEIRPLRSTEQERASGQLSAPGHLSLAVRVPSATVLRWSSVPVRRVKHPRLQFDKGLRIDLLA